MENAAQAVSWMGIIAGAVVSFLLGWLWYSPKLFGVKWAEGSGVDLKNSSEMPVTALVVQFVAILLLSIVIGVTASTNALFTAILAILAVCAFVVSAGMFLKKSQTALMIEGGFVLAIGVVMILFQGIF